MTTFMKNAWHYLVVLAGIGAVSALAAVGHLTTVASTLIGTLTGATVAGGLVAAASGSTPPKPAA